MTVFRRVREFVEQRLGGFESGRVELLGKPAIDRCQQIARRRLPSLIYTRRRHRSAKAAYSREPRRVELREQLRRPLAAIAKNKVVGEIVDEDPDRWSQSSAGREYKMKGNFLRAPTGEYPNQASFSNRSHGNFSR